MRNLHFVAFGRRDQQDEEFFATGADLVRELESELKRLSKDIPATERRALEIGCGPGRLIRPMSRHFGEIHGIDVSDVMIERAWRNCLASSTHMSTTRVAATCRCSRRRTSILFIRMRCSSTFPVRRWFSPICGKLFASCGRAVWRGCRSTGCPGPPARIQPGKEFASGAMRFTPSPANTACVCFR